MSVGKKLNKKYLLSSNLATKKGYCTQQRSTIKNVRVIGELRYPTLQTKLEALNMPDHCTQHVFYCLLCAVNFYSKWKQESFTTKD